MSQVQKNLHFVCSVSELAHAQCVEFELPDSAGGTDSTDRAAFLINWNNIYHAYLNSCPHTGVNLNWAPNQFLDIESRYLFCGLHGALFEPDTGLCLHGPCLGQSLRSLPVVMQNQQLFIDIEALQKG